MPLIIKSPGAAPGVIGQPVSLVAIAPTLLDLLGIDPEPWAFDATSLAPLVFGEAPGEPMPAFAEVDFEVASSPMKQARQKAVIHGRFKLIRRDRSRAVELYDLQSDPAEKSDLAARQRALVERLTSTLDAHLARQARVPVEPPRQRLSPQEIESLRDLGYIDAAR